MNFSSSLQAIRKQKRAAVHRCRTSSRRWLARGYFRLASKQGVFRIHVPQMGLFAHLSWVLIGLAWSERAGLKIHFKCTNPQYNRSGQENDWLNDVVIQASAPIGREFAILDYWEFPFANQAPGLITREEARQLFRRHLSIRKDLALAGETWFRDRLEDRFVIGVHFRGSDKMSEAPRVEYGVVVSAINKMLALLLDRGIERPAVFIATDESEFLTTARPLIKGGEVHALEGVLRATGDVGVHNNSAHDGSRLLHEAVTDASLLSKTTILLKTASALSAWSALIGPKMPVFFLSQPYEHAMYFPDNILLKESFTFGQEEPAIEAAAAAFHLSQRDDK